MEAQIKPSSHNKVVLALALPAIVEMLLQLTVGLADTAMVGRLGAQALAAVGLANQLLMLLSTILSAIGTGNTALVARHVGAGEFEIAGRIAKQAVILAVIIAVVSGAVVLSFGDAVLGFLFRSTEPEVIGLASDYVAIVSLALAFNYCLILINSALRGAGDTKTPMQITAIVNIINIIGNFFLIYGIGPFPVLGVQGAAIATAAAQTVGGVLALISLYRNPNIKVSFSLPIRIDREIVKRILKIGVPAAVEQGSMRIGQLFYTMIIASLGTVAYAAHQVALNAESISFNPGFGFALAATTLVGQYLGADKPELAEQFGYRASKMAVVFMSIMGVVFFLFAEQIVYLFTPDQEVIALASVCLRIVAVSQPALAAQMVFAGGLRGAGDTRGILWITLTGFMVVRVGLTLILSLWLDLGLIGAWIAMGVDLYYRSILMWSRFRRGSWKTLKI
ncbi:MAG: MATE family efflux transporter [Candidatus Wallacebacter cryptica]|jgi:putative MATE family efflux protein|nr:MATE family efflux transporter [Bacillota bacterium]